MCMYTYIHVCMRVCVCVLPSKAHNIVYKTLNLGASIAKQL